MTQKLKKSKSEGKQHGNIMLRKGHWYVRVVVRGRQIWRSAPDKDSAQKLLGDLRKDIARDKVGLPRKVRHTLASWAPHYMEWARAHKRSWKRDQWCLTQLLQTFGTFRLNDIDKARVEAFMRDRKKEVAPSTVNRQVALLRKVLSHAVESGEIEVNPLRGIKLFQESPGRMPTLEPKDEKLLLEACPPWLRFLVRLAIASGCRQGELLALRWRHVDFDNGALVVEDSKSGESRRVPLHPVMLEELRTIRGLPDGYVVTYENGRPPAADNVSSAFKKAARKIERGDLRFHDLRHIAGSRLLAAGAALPEVASFLGHKTLIMARRYSHTSWTRLRDLVGQVPVES